MQTGIQIATVAGLCHLLGRGIRPKWGRPGAACKQHQCRKASAHRHTRPFSILKASPKASSACAGTMIICLPDPWPTAVSASTCLSAT